MPQIRFRIGHGLPYLRENTSPVELAAMIEPKVSIQRLKNFAYEEIPTDNALREILLSEHNELGATEFCCKIDVWLKLLRRAHT